MGNKVIAVLTSGGDAPGMNAAIRAIVRSSISKGIRVLGIRRGYSGLIGGDIFEMNLRSVSDIIHRGGTILYTARSPEFKTQEGLNKAKEICEDIGLNGLIVIGGNGSLKGTRDLSRLGIPCIGIPGTIDNDLACSEYTIGFDTAMNTAMEMVDRIRDTAQSHDRCSIVEVMGRHCGDIALHTGISVGATAILIPEVNYDFNKDIIERINFTQKIGKKHFIIIISEGLGKAHEITNKIQKSTGIEARLTILGHVQRGGSPTLRDRVIASQMGCRATELLSENIANKIIALKDDKIVEFNIEEALQMKKSFNSILYNKALEISI